jgi:hypothetical protein
LNHDQFAELIGFVRLAFADHLGVCFKYAEQFSLAARGISHWLYGGA